MQVTFEALAALSLSQIRGLMPAWVAGHITDPERRASAEVELGALFGSVSDAALLTLQGTFNGAGSAWQHYPADPVARKLTRLYMGFLVDAPAVDGLAHLERFLTEGPKRRFIVSNHLSYTDTQVTDRVLADLGRDDVADRLVAIAGPKVYTDPWRRLAAISLHTRKTPQSNVVATEQDSLAPRELAAIAMAAIDDCFRLADAGFIPLLYPEGARSRDGRLRPFLRASARYLAGAEVQILPLAHTGSERIFAIGETTMTPGRVRLSFGEPFLAAAYPGKTGPIVEAHRRLAQILPEAYRPDPAEGALI